MEANAFIVNELLDGKSNYEKWSIQVKTYLWGRDLWDTVDPDVEVNEDEETDRKNAVALHAILISCETEPFQVIKSITSAREAWAALQAEYAADESEPERAEHQLDRSISRNKSLQRNDSKISKPTVEVVAGNELKRPVESESESESQSESESEDIQSEASKPKIPPPVAGAGNVEKGEESNSVDIRPYWKMFQAVKRGDWNTTRAFLDEDPEAIQATIPYSGKNVLHVAVSEGHLHIVEKLVARMTDEQIEMRRVDSFTPLAAAIEIGSLPIARCLIKRHKKLVSITHPEGLPVRHAIVSCRKNMVPFLFSVTPIEDLKSVDNGIHCAALLSQCIYAKHYDIALRLLIRVPELVITVDDPGKSPLWALATSKLFSDNESTLIFWQRWIYNCIHIPSGAINHISVEIENPDDYQSDKEDSNLDKAIDSFCVAGRMCSGMLRRVVLVPLRLLDIKSLYQMKLVHEQTKEILRRVCQVIEGTSDRMRLQNAGLSSSMIQAAYHGNVHFITGIAKANPELVWGPYISRKVIEVAIQHRQPKIFNLVYGLRDKVAMASYRDENRSNMLHKAAIIAPPRLLNRIPGAALQMQRELHWFKEVETIVSPAATIATTAAHPGSTKKKKEYLTPHDIFTESHKDLVIAGEKWMKDTSSSCTVVGALIITVTFAAAFTFPGGNEQTRGYPMFSGKLLFWVFMISNAVALSASTSSVLMFLGILTSRYAEEDFLTSLPKKLIIGLSTLFFSIAAMLTAFCAGLSLMFHEALWIVLPSALLASIPVALFAAIQFPLLVDIFMSTYGPSIFFKNNQRWI